ncbi:hypothetical protein TNCV_1928931 [Trichonephila clavipes]|nr:hypothetical protein TNCV_1928931 [Trichonephila clavipes]
MIKSIRTPLEIVDFTNIIELLSSRQEKKNSDGACLTWSGALGKIKFLEQVRIVRAQLPSSEEKTGRQSYLRVAPYRRIPNSTINFDAQFPPQRELPELQRCEPVLEFNFAENIQTKNHNHTTRSPVDFLHHENPPTWSRVEPVTFGTEG